MTEQEALLRAQRRKLEEAMLSSVCTSDRDHTSARGEDFWIGWFGQKQRFGGNLVRWNTIFLKPLTQVLSQRSYHFLLVGQQQARDARP